MKTSLPSSHSKLAKAFIAKKSLLILSVILLCFGNGLYADVKPTITSGGKTLNNTHRQGKKIVRNLPKAGHSSSIAAPVISYSTPNVYNAGTPITTLAPISSGVAAAAYDNVPVNVGSVAGPRNVALDAAGNLYVADYLSGVIKKFFAGGGAPVTLGSGFIHPIGVAVDIAGNVYVADISDTNIKMIPAGGGAPVIVGTGVSNPFSVAVDAAGNVFVADYGNKVVKKIPADGSPMVVIGSGFNSVVSVAVDAAGNVYAGDQANQNIYKIPVGGGAPVVIGTGFGAPNAIAFDGAGNMYVTDANNNVVKKVPADGSATIIIGSGPGIMTGVAVKDDGTIYVADYSNAAVRKFNPVGGYYLSAPLPAGLAFDVATGNFTGTPTASNPATNYIVTAYNSTGSTQATVNIKINALTVAYNSPVAYVTATAVAPLLPSSSGVAAAGYANNPVTVGFGFNKPRAAVIDAAGNIFIADYGGNVIKKIPAGGGAITTVATGFSGPAGVAVDAAGNLYVADYLNNAVKKVPAGGGATVTIGSGFVHPFGIAVDGTGNVFVADNGNHAMKEILAANGTTINLGTYTNPLGVTTDVYNNIYFGESTNGVVYKIAASGGAPVIMASGFTLPYGLALDASGNLFVADGGTGGIKEVSLTTNTVISIGSGFNIPTGVAADASGNIYVTDYANGAVKIMKPSGGYYINALPAGLNFDNATGILSGTPAVASPASFYTVTAYNSFGSNSAAISIQVNQLPLPAVSYTTPPINFSVNTPVPPLAPVSTGVAAPGYNTNLYTLKSGFNNPIGLAVDGALNVIIAEAGNGLVRRMSPGNNTAFVIGTGFNYPSGAATDAAGNVYVADQLNNSIKKIVIAGNTTTLIASGFNNPCGVAIDAAGNIYVADKGNNAVKKIAAAGGAVTIIGSGFSQPSGVVVDAAGNVYVADYGNNAIKMIPVGGGAPVALGSGFNQPTALALDLSGNLYIADTGSNTIQKMPVTGGTPVIISTSILHPLGIAVDLNGIVYVTDNVYGKVKELIPSGGYYISPSLSAGLNLDSATGVISGTPTAAKPQTNYHIAAYNSTGASTATVFLQVDLFPVPTISYATPQSFIINTAVTPITPVSTNVSAISFNNTPVSIGTGFSLPNGVAVDNAGNVYVADKGNGLVKKIQKAGGATVSIGSGFNNPNGVAVDGAGNVYVADNGNNKIYKIPVGGGATTAIGGNGFVSPAALAVDSAGNVFVNDNGPNSIKKIPVDGTATVTVATGFGSLGGIAIDNSGNIYVADWGSNVIIKVPADGTSNVAISSGFNQPLGVAVDAAGNVFVADFNNNAVKMIPADGSPKVTLGSGFNHTYGVAVDALGNVYTSDYLNSAIKKIIPVGGYFIGPGLPAGITFNSNTGVIGGTPTAGSPATNYTVTGYNVSASNTANVNITVNVSPPPTISYSSPQKYNTGTAIVPLSPTASGVAAAGFANTAFKISTVALPFSVAVDGMGNVYVGDRSDNTVKKIAYKSTIPVVIASGFNSINGIAADALGNIYVADGNSVGLKKIPAGGGAVVIVGSGFVNPYYVAIGITGNLYVVDQNNSNIYKMDAAGGAKTLVANIPGPAGIAVDAAGNVYVACTSLGVVKKIPVDGSPVVSIGGGFDQPYGLAVDNLGDIFVADFNNNGIRKISVSALNTTFVGPSFFHPTGVAIDALGNIYVAEFGFGLVKMFNRAGGYYTNPALPAGLGIDINSGVISGTPTVPTPAANYNISAFNPSGAGTAVLNIKTLTISSNAALAQLTTSSGTLNPVFAGATTSYSAIVPNASSAIKVTPTAADANATIKINGVTVASGSASGSIALSVGSNVITTVVTASDGTTTKTYTLTVTRVAAGFSINASLSVLKLSPVTALTIVSGPGYKNYTTDVLNTQSSLKVVATAQDATATIKVNGVTVTSGVASPDIPLNVGANVISVVVTAQDGATTHDYIITATRALSSNATLSNLAASNCTISPVFAAATTAYTAIVPNAIAAITVTPTATDAGATVTVNGTAVTPGSASGSIVLNAGSNVITTVVTAADGTTTKTYTLTVTRAAAGLSTNAILSALKLNPVFALTTVSGPGYRNYTAAIPNSQANLAVISTAQDVNASIVVNGVSVASGAPSQFIQLNVGDNVINVTVTAEDGATVKTYIITAKRAASAIATLSNFTTSSGTLNPVFASATGSYTAIVPNATSSIKVTPTTTDAGAIVTINGTAVTSGSASGSIALSVGSNVITTVVTASNGTTTKTYTLTVTRVAAGFSINASLSILKLSPVTALTIVSGPGYKNYTTDVPNSQSSLKVVATAQDATATIKVNGVTVTSGVASPDIPLNVGANVISVVVTAQDGATTHDYIITATRALSSISTLSNLAASNCTINPVFAAATTAYTAIVPNAIAAITVTPTTTDGGATVTVNGTTVTSGSTSGSIVLSAGSNIITTVVTSADGTTTKTYTLTVTRAAAGLSTNAILSALKLSPVFALTTVSGPGYRNYTAAIPNSQTGVMVIATAQDATAAIQVNGAMVSSGSASQLIPMSIGDNVINITVTAQDGATVKAYIITATRATGPLSMALSAQATDTLKATTDGITVHAGLSPNGDGINDVLTIDGLNKYPDNKLSIMNTGGTEVYTAFGYDNANVVFDGHSSKTRQMQKPGTYFYQLEYKDNGKTKYKTGYILLKY